MFQQAAASGGSRALALSSQTVFDRAVGDEKPWLKRQIEKVNQRLGFWWAAYPAGLCGPFLIEYFVRWFTKGNPPHLTAMFGSGQALPPAIVVAGFGAMSMRGLGTNPAGTVKWAARALAVSAVLSALTFAATIATVTTARQSTLDALEQRTTSWSLGLGGAVVLAGALGEWNAHGD